jgi:hypothetical protein
MPRTTITRTTPLGPYPTLQPAVDSLDCVMTACDVANGNQFVLDGPVLLILQNTDGASARTVTLTSAVDGQNRSGDVTAYSLGIGEIAVFKVDQVMGWRQTDGMFYLAASNVAVKFGIVRL